jgi:endonuclease NucS-like protein
MEHRFPGMWQRWYKAQCAAVGWPLQSLGVYSTDVAWSACQNRLGEMSPGDWIAVQLRGRRIARLGEIVRLEVADTQWNPLVRPTKQLPEGEMGRRIIARWSLEGMPDDPDIVVKLPDSLRLAVRQTINRLGNIELGQLHRIARDSDNWIDLSKRFRWETELSSYIGAYPHRLEDGLLPFPDCKVCETRFADGTRSDVLLEDGEGRAVMVECKQGSPDEAAIRQLNGYMKHVKRDTNREVRGILCHGGARRVRPEVRRLAEKVGDIEFVYYRLDVRFGS